MRILWSREARADQQRIWLFLAEIGDAYADRVEARVEERANSLLFLPRLGRPIPGSSARRLSVNDIQYLIDYQIDDEVVRILRIRSTRQNRTDR